MNRRRLAATCAAVLLMVAGCSSDPAILPVETKASASSSAAGSSPAALTDGDVTSQRLAAEWTAAPQDPAPWVRLDLSRERRIASIQVFGPGGSSIDLAQLHGVLSFSDGSTVPVSSVDGGEGPATTIAFSPRTVRWVKLDLSPTAAAATVRLRELAVYDVGVTPPRWSESGARYSVDLQTAACSPTIAAASPFASALPGRLSLACPQPGSAVGDSATVVVRADPGRRVAIGALLPTGRTSAADLSSLQSAVADSSGLATLQLDLSALPSGPVTLRATGAGAGADEAPLDIQLVRTDGRPVSDASSVSHQPIGATLQWDEEFDGPVSVSGTGQGATYATSKPEKQGASQFGDAVFADPVAGADAVATIPRGYLRIRAQPIGDHSVNTDSGQTSLTGFLSSGRVGGSGFSAQYGYFEARMFGGPGPGTWPAFWMLDSEAATPRQDGAGEIDAVELYGHATRASCHTVHDWGVVAGESAVPTCIEPNGFSDWAMSWHVYGAQVTPTSTIFSIDGVVVAERPAISKQSSPYFFMLDLALGGGWPVDLSGTGGVSDLYVDWVRVYT